MSKVFISVAIIFTFLLFYIDEGYYDFRWMKEWGNWIVFLLYVGVMYVFQEIFFKLTKQKIGAIIFGVSTALISLIWLLS